MYIPAYTRHTIDRRACMHNSSAVRTEYVYYFRKDAESYG